MKSFDNMEYTYTCYFIISYSFLLFSPKRYPNAKVMIGVIIDHKLFALSKSLEKIVHTIPKRRSRTIVKPAMLLGDVLGLPQIFPSHPISILFLNFSLSLSSILFARSLSLGRLRLAICHLLSEIKIKNNSISTVV